MCLLRTFLLYALLLPLSGWCQIAAIKGHVVDENGPVPFINITLKGTGLGTASDENGAFEMQGLEPGKYTLVVSGLGYQTHQQRIRLEGTDLTSLHIMLQPTSE